MCSCAANISTRPWAKAACAIYDIANVDNKDFSERVTSRRFRRSAKRFYVKTKYATAVAAPTTLALDPLRDADSRERRAADSSDLRFSLRRGQRRRPGRHRRSEEPRRRHVARRRSRATIFSSARWPSTRTASERARGASPSPELTPTSFAIAAWSWWTSTIR